MLCTLILVSLAAVLFVGGAVAVAIPMERAKVSVVKRAILAITAITIVLMVGVIVDGVNLKEVLAGESAHIHETEIIEGLAKENESILLAPKPDSAGKKLLGVEKQ
jgi:hypothetical protein